MKHLKKKFVQHPAANLDTPERRCWMQSMRQQIRACDWHAQDEQGRAPTEFVVMHPVDRALGALVSHGATRPAACACVGGTMWWKLCGGN